MFKDCSQTSLILIPGQSSLPNPLQYRRSQDFYISSSIDFLCASPARKITYQWLINICIRSSCRTPAVDSNGPINSRSSELYIPSRTLSYGVYQMTLLVRLNSRSNIQSSVFVQINPSGITANLVELGTSMITRGHLQDLLFDPGRYSVDPDEDSFNASVR